MRTIGAQIVEELGFTGCVELTNGPARVVLDPTRGGRVLVYALDGENVLYVDAEIDRGEDVSGWAPTGGRCDIGPERAIPPHPLLWRGAWEAEITGDRAATLRSPICPATGLRLSRRFTLAEDASHLMFTQVVTHAGDDVQQVCHWGRTLVLGGGTCLVPLHPRSRYPEGYLLYGPGDVMDYRPGRHPHVTIEHGLMAIRGPQERCRYAFDTDSGWLACLTRNHRLFVKTFGIFPGRVYGDMTAATATVRYHGERACALEPIGPLETLSPGDSVSFTENWWLFTYPYPCSGDLDVCALRERIERWL